MVTKIIYKNTNVVILAGGFGKRLRPVSKKLPKPLVKVNGSRFLDILIDFWAGFGFNRFILCTGYKSAMIKNHCAKSGKKNISVLFSDEETPLGTGGAVKNARRFISSNPFIVLNGDSFCKLDPLKLLEFHRKNKALVSVELAKVPDAKDYGEVRLNKQRIISFSEKNQAVNDGLINCGVYVFNQEVFRLMPEKREFSLEKDFFPKAVKKRIFGHIGNNFFIDIGTPDRYKKAQKWKI